MFTKGQLSAASNSDYLAARSTKQANLTIAHSTYVIYTSLSSKLSLLEVSEEKKAKYIVRVFSLKKPNFPRSWFPFQTKFPPFI